MTIGQIAATAFVALLTVLAIFQIALAAGAPLGHLAWGGQDRTLPSRRRIGSVASVAAYIVMAWLALDRAGVIELLPDVASRIGMWVVFGYLVLSIVPNLLTKSRLERAVMTPVATVLAALALLVALA